MLENTCMNVTKGLLGLLSRINGHFPEEIARFMWLCNEGRVSSAQGVNRQL
jgi:hypothetical protein